MTLEELKALGVPDDKIQAVLDKHKAEYDSVTSKAATLEQSLAKAKTYEDWYAKNENAIKALQAQALRYQERYGNLDDPGNKPPEPTKQFSAEDVAKLVDERVTGIINSNYAPVWSNLVTGAAGVMMKHVQRGRKGDVDWKKLEEIARSNGGNLDRAYDEWDSPNLKADEDAQREKLVEERVKERLQKERQKLAGVPGAGDNTPGYSPGVLSKQSGAAKTYDRSKLLETAATGVYERPTVQ